MGTLAKSETTKPPADKTLREFLETTPPGVNEVLSDLGIFDNRPGTPAGYLLTTPDIELHCDSATCGGPRTFQCVLKEPQVLRTNWDQAFLPYICRNCRATFKLFALRFRSVREKQGEALKIGELPIFGPHTPARVISLIGPDRDLFLKGRRAENQGLGIGAFGYYRRVVENQKGRIIEEIGKVAQKVGANPSTIEAFNVAASETQFSRAIDAVRGAIPEMLLIEGENPLSLLHSALSEGLHASSDEECLGIAQNIRVVLSEMADRISRALKDDQELKNAVKALIQRRAEAKPRTPPE